MQQTLIVTIAVGLLPLPLYDLQPQHTSYQLANRLVFANALDPLSTVLLWRAMISQTF